MKNKRGNVWGKEWEMKEEGKRGIGKGDRQGNTGGWKEQEIEIEKRK